MNENVRGMDFKNNYHINELINKQEKEIVEYHPMMSITNSINLSKASK